MIYKEDGDDHLESLLRIAEMITPLNIETDVFKRDIKNFIHEIGLEIGQNTVPVKKVYDAYKKIRKDHAMTRYQFSLHFKAFFQPKEGGSFTYYYLNAEVLGLSPVYTVFTDKQYFPPEGNGRDDKYKKQRRRKAERAKKEKEALDAQAAKEQERNKK